MMEVSCGLLAQAAALAHAQYTGNKRENKNSPIP